MTEIELRQISLEFRRKASNLLTSTMENADVNLLRFAAFIDSTPFIADCLKQTFDGIDYDYKQCFHIGGDDWSSINPPVNEKAHIKAMYDYLSSIASQ